MPPTLQAVGKLKAQILEQATRKPAPGSNAPWRELIARSPDIAVVETRGEDGKNTAPGIRSPLREVGLIGMVFVSAVAIGLFFVPETKDRDLRDWH